MRVAIVPGLASLPYPASEASVKFPEAFLLGEKLAAVLC